ncbi:GIY-YIG nuclease family protein [Streptomyces sp. CB01201]|uniref:GIY-YIG nuclease family protein n=1 Tax=Streptomyces sp. CB01201 TaxID=2020324 RepID=UPI00131CE647|nr:GIY-YIG nuclease family protein [Streptomyces sp. CB01201]
MSAPPERTALHDLYSTQEHEGLHPFLDELYPQFLLSLHYMGTADSCPNGGPGVRYGLWDFEEVTLVRVIKWGRPQTPVPTALYRLRGQDNSLLYVGISDAPKRRLKDHAGDKPWWPLVASHSIEWFPTRAHALAAEAKAIRAEQPVHNIHFNGRKRAS